MQFLFKTLKAHTLKIITRNNKTELQDNEISSFLYYTINIFGVPIWGISDSSVNAMLLDILWHLFKENKNRK